MVTECVLHGSFAFFVLLTARLTLQTSAAHESAKQLLLVDIILLVVEGAVLIPLAFLYMYWVICTITIDRVSLYSIFLRVPRPTVVAISKTEVRLVGEEGFEDDDDPVVRVVASACAVQSIYIEPCLYC